MMKQSTIWKEVKKQLMNSPSFSLEIPSMELAQPHHLEHLDQQIEKALKDSKSHLVFLVGPFGGGKSTQIHHYLNKRPKSRFIYKSFVKINTLDLAFLHLTNYISRLFFILSFLLIALFLIYTIPESGALPFLLIIGYLFVKNAGNLIYILHEAFDNFFIGKDRLIILEDFERSSLSGADQFALLANLWQLKRAYLISMGYSTDDRKAKLQIIENAQKLGGVVIEILPYKRLNHLMMKQFDPLFPFTIDDKKEAKRGAWITLFNLQELLMIQEQAALRSLPQPSAENIQAQYIHICLKTLLEKLELTKSQIMYDEKKKSFLHYSVKDLSPQQAFFLSSFIESVNQ